MSVIITGMYEPECCKDCYLSAGYGCELKGQIMTTAEMQKRDPDCPIKSVDGLINKLADMADSDAYGDYQLGTNYGLMLTAKIVKEYCEI